MKAAWLVSVLLAGAPSVGLCDGYFRCGSSLVSSDTTLADLVKKCGEPTSKKVSLVDVFGESGRKIGVTQVEIWRYERGSSAPAMIVKVVDGKVDSIGEAGDD